MRTSRGVLAMLAVLAVASCGGNAPSAVRIDGPEVEPRRNAVRTLEPGATPSPSPPPTPTPVPTPTPEPVPPPGGATLTSGAGTQQGDPSSFCWSEHEGGASSCYTHDRPSQDSRLAVTAGERVILRIDARIAPDDESIRPFRQTRSGYPSQRIDAALETEITVELPEGEWSMDVCATWHGRGQPICWLFELLVAA